MRGNAQNVADYFREQGWSRNAIIALVANMEAESTINPGLWENREAVAGNGFGLVQWTPASKYRQWVQQLYPLEPIANGERECERIIYELDNGLQWITTADYPLSFSEFTRSSRDIEWLTYAWMYNYERPGSLNQPWRKEYARYWASVLRLPLPIWLLFKLSERRLKHGH